ncbi:hypothetical protein KBD11_02055 [Candidatus Saccharibacteria bacterium]|nr:hypothetical protein [Candidatus Saccharibacteria bacterium]
MEPASPFRPKQTNSPADDRLAGADNEDAAVAIDSIKVDTVGTSVDGIKHPVSDESSAWTSAQSKSDDLAGASVEVAVPVKTDEPPMPMDQDASLGSTKAAVFSEVSDRAGAPVPVGQVISSPDLSAEDVTTPGEANSDSMAVAVAPAVAGVTGGNGQQRSKKKWLLPVAVGGLVALLAGGYVLGFYLPNRPENAYKIGMKLTGVATDKIIAYAEERKDLTTVDIDASAAIKSAGGSYDLKMKGQSSDTALNMSMDANIAGEKMNIALRAASASQSTNPDIYFKATGVASLLSQISSDPKIAGLDDQWIVVDHTILDTYDKQIEATTGTSLRETPTQEQLIDALTKVQQVNKEHLFTANSDKSVLVYKEYVGKATRNSRPAFHYRTGYDKENFKAYINAIGDALDKSSLNEWSKNQSSGKNISAILELKSLAESIDKTKGDETFDLYVDAGTKVIQSIVFTDTKGGGGVLTLAQNYTGGDTYPFELSFKSAGESSIDQKYGMTINTKTDKTLFSVKIDTPEENNMSLEVTGSLTPSKAKVAVETPTGALPITQVMQLLGVDPSILTEPSAVVPAPSSVLVPSRT